MEHPENQAEYKGLNVNSGVTQPPVVNPYLVRRKRRTLPSAGEMVEGILKGDTTMLSRAVTLVESLSPDHQAIAVVAQAHCLCMSVNHNIFHVAALNVVFLIVLQVEEHVRIV